MIDLIDRQAAIDVLEEQLQANGYSNVDLVSELNRSIGYLMRIPAAERKGHWKNAYELTEYRYRCSECFANHRARYDYCPSCGARMDGE